MKNKITFRKFMFTLLVILFIGMLFCSLRLGEAILCSVLSISIILYFRWAIKNATDYEKNKKRL